MIRRLLPFLTLIVLFVFLAVASPYFLTSTNLSSVVRQTAVINTMALGMTMIIVSHELGFVREVADRVGFLDGGQILEWGTPSEIFDRPRHARTLEFFQKIL